ncbi:hypothetical protein L596_005723 [Steinernema carpocapsae]|uniref:Uncharacterized protein n=1 Tax=Steinernema carpocapsae TaxID=34508 RepID=A0A4V6I8Q0_STECR|nr:hypothetical protein L596_005723 [Steinernema carpocapsae]
MAIRLFNGCLVSCFFARRLKFLFYKIVSKLYRTENIQLIIASLTVTPNVTKTLVRVTNTTKINKLCKKCFYVPAIARHDY